MKKIRIYQFVTKGIVTNKLTLFEFSNVNEYVEALNETEQNPYLRIIDQSVIEL